MSDAAPCTMHGSGSTAEPWTCDAHPMARLLDVLREELRLTGTKEGCGEGECGACSVLVDGELVTAACRRCCRPTAPRSRRSKASPVADAPARRAAGLHRARRRTVRHLHAGHDPRGGRAARAHPDPTEAEIRAGLAGNLCRCTGYMRIFECGACKPAASDESRSCPHYDCSRRVAARRRWRCSGRAGRWRPFAGGTDLMVLLEAGTLPQAYSACGSSRSSAASRTG